MIFQCKNAKTRKKIFSLKQARYYYIKFIRSPGTPGKIATSVAIGLFVCFFFPLGFHVPTTLLLTFIFRSPKMIALVSTLPTNPYTVPFIYPFQCYIGSFFVGVPFGEMREHIVSLIDDFTLKGLFNVGDELLISFFAGGFIFAVISAATGYWVTYWIIVHYRRNRKERAKWLNPQKR